MRNAYFRLFSTLLIFISFSQNAFSQDKKLPHPRLSANFEVAEYQGQKGCILNNGKYIAAISINSGAFLKGALRSVQSPRDGAYHETFFYNENEQVGYVMSNKQDGKLCLVDKIEDVSMGAAGAHSQVVFEGKISKAQCDQIPNRFEGICGSFKTLSAKLISKGFKLLWQGVDKSGHIKTWLSGNDKTYVLTTDKNNNATVLTGVSNDGNYKLYQKPTTN